MNWLSDGYISTFDTEEAIQFYKVFVKLFVKHVKKVGSSEMFERDFASVYSRVCMCLPENALVCVGSDIWMITLISSFCLGTTLIKNPVGPLKLLSLQTIAATVSI